MVNVQFDVEALRSKRLEDSNALTENSKSFQINSIKAQQ